MRSNFHCCRRWVFQWYNNLMFLKSNSLLGLLLFFMGQDFILGCKWSMREYEIRGSYLLRYFTILSYN